MAVIKLITAVIKMFVVLSLEKSKFFVLFTYIFKKAVNIKMNFTVTINESVEKEAYKRE